MITKDEAAALAKEYSAKLPDRVSTYLENLARGGVLGSQLTYDAATDSKDVDVAKAELDGAGWDVVHDANAKTLTITPKP